MLRHSQKLHGAVLSASEDFFGLATERNGASIRYDMPAAEYHADADGPRLSQSLATVAVTKSMRHVHQIHPLLGSRPPAGERWEFEPDTSDGTIIHALVLEPDSNIIREIDPSSIRTKDGKVAKSPFATEEGKAIRDAALAEGRIPLLSEALGVYKYKAKALRSRFYDEGEALDGRSEVVIYWNEETPSGPVRCRTRIDHLIVAPERILIRDLKTSKDASPNQLRSSCYEYGYDIQRAANIRAVEAVFPDYVGRVDFSFLFGELEKPYVVNVCRLDAEFSRMGEVRWERGRDMWAECLKKNHWPGYPGTELAPPGWALAREGM